MQNSSFHRVVCAYIPDGRTAPRRAALTWFVTTYPSFFSGNHSFFSGNPSFFSTKLIFQWKSLIFQWKSLIFQQKTTSVKSYQIGARAWPSHPTHSLFPMFLSNNDGICINNDDLCITKLWNLYWNWWIEHFKWWTLYWKWWLVH